MQPDPSAESLVAALVAAQERRDYYKARAEQMERDHASYVQGMRDNYGAEIKRLLGNGEVLVSQIATAEAAGDRLAEQYGAMERRSQRFQDAISRVRALHHPDAEGTSCAYEEGVDWPCSTIRALDGGASDDSR